MPLVRTSANDYMAPRHVRLLSLQGRCRFIRTPGPLCIPNPISKAIKNNAVHKVEIDQFDGRIQWKRSVLHVLFCFHNSWLNRWNCMLVTYVAASFGRKSHAVLTASRSNSHCECQLLIVPRASQRNP
jgi:hypothetical protein